MSLLNDFFNLIYQGGWLLLVLTAGGLLLMLGVFLQTLFRLAVTTQKSLHPFFNTVQQLDTTAQKIETIKQSIEPAVRRIKTLKKYGHGLSMLFGFFFLKRRRQPS